MKLKKGDMVVVVSGKDKGKRGKIERVFPKSNKIAIPEINIYKRHVKARDQKNPGGIIDVVRPLSVSNVMFVCPKCKLPTRVGYTITPKGKKRMCKKCKQTL